MPISAIVRMVEGPNVSLPGRNGATPASWAVTWAMNSTKNFNRQALILKSQLGRLSG